MKVKAIMAISVVALLAACGGGGGSVSNTPPTTSPTVDTLIAYNNGSGVISVAGAESNATIITNNLSVAREIASGSIALSVVQGSSTTNGSYYTVSRTGTASNGSAIRVDTTGENLNQSGSEYVSASLITVGSAIGISATGSPVNGMPVGTQTYTGRASVVDASSVGDGTFTMTANFNSNTATIASTIPATGSNPAFFFSSNSLQINSSNGQFSTSTALIGETGVTSQAASINGYFAGTNAAGVHGLVYTNAASGPTYFGAFAGSR